MLTIKSAEIVKNSRILLGEDCHIRYNPSSPYQVIIGQNGIGKTTFLANLISYPSKGTKSFHKDGFSSIIFEKDGEEFTTITRDDGKYIFTRGDGVDGNLNIGGTQGVQRELFAEHLGIDAFTESILSPKFDFLAMSAAKRQEFFAQLAIGDLSEGLSIFKRLEQRARQHDATVKRIESNLAELKAKVIPEEEYEDYKSRLAEITGNIKELYLEMSSEGSYGHVASHTELDKMMDALETKLTSGWTKVYCFGGVNANSVEEAELKITLLRANLVRLRSVYQSKVEEFTSLDDLRRSLGTDGSNLTSLREEEADLVRKLDGMLGEDLLLPITFRTSEDCAEALKTLEELIDELTLDISELDGERGESLLQCDLEALYKEAIEIQAGINKIVVESERISQELEHQHQGEVRCPDCGKSFNPALDERRKARAEKRLDELQSAHHRGSILYSEKRKVIDEATQYTKSYSEIRRKYSSAVLAPVFRYIESQCTIASDPGKFVMLMQQALHTLTWREAELYAQEDLAKVRNTIRIMEERDLGSSVLLEEKMAGIELTLFELEPKIKRLNDEIQDFENRLRKAKEYDKWVDDVIAEHDAVGVAVFTKARKELDEIFTELLETLQASANELSQSISNYEQSHAQVAYMEELLELERTSAVAVKKAADELSPKTGAIAEQLFGYIEGWLDDVMDVISRIWMYEVKIYPAKDSDKGLSYIFPVRFNDSDKESSDIADTSTGQYNIINFAAKIVSLRHRGYTEGPVFLDEPDGTLTPHHKVKMMQFIRELIEDGIFSQVFIISHHESGWGALPYPDIIDFSYELASPETNKVIKFK